jgi:hypothetical protein
LTSSFSSSLIDLGSIVCSFVPAWHEIQVVGKPPPNTFAVDRWLLPHVFRKLIY